MSIVKKNICGLIAVAFTVALVGVAQADQPQMESSLQALQGAQAELAKVTLNKDGHANKARQLVAKAIAEVEAGIAYGKAHGF